MLLRLDRRRPHRNGHNNAHDELQVSTQKGGIPAKDVNKKKRKVEEGEEVSMEAGKEDALGHVGKRCYERLARGLGGSGRSATLKKSWTGWAGENDRAWRVEGLKK
jgi:hypothetical protein